ncbi:MFS transporter [Methanomassiliicoccaceae archaeon DOK]|nr:MFS transporter [Methanomassiliicoccaceae archaeon DOK]
MSEIASDALSALRRYRWAIFAVLTVGYFFVYFHRISVSVVGQDIVADVGGSIGFLSSVYYWTYTAMQIPSGVMADRFGARAASTVFLLIASIGSLVTCVGTEFWMIVLGKVMIAAGMAVVYVPLMKLVSVWFPKSDFAVLSGVVIAVGNVGAIAATGPLELMAQALGWREVFLVLGVITLVLAVLCATVIRNHPKDRGLPSVEAVELSEHGTAVVESSAARIPVMKGLRIVLSGGRKFWTCALAYFLVYGSIMTFQGTWAVTYFNNVYDFVLSASWMVTALGVGKILSTLAIGGMTSRGIIRSKRKAMIYGTSVFTVLWAVIFVFAGDIDSYWFWFAVSFAFGFFGGFMTLSFTQVKEWYPIAISGTAVSGTNIFLFLGASVCTTISGAIIGTAYTLGNFTVLWGLMLLFSAVAVVLLVLSVEKRPEDPPVGVELVRKASDS